MFKIKYYNKLCLFLKTYIMFARFQLDYIRVILKKRCSWASFYLKHEIQWLFLSVIEILVKCVSQVKYW